MFIIYVFFNEDNKINILITVKVESNNHENFYF